MPPLAPPLPVGGLLSFRSGLVAGASLSLISGSLARSEPVSELSTLVIKSGSASFPFKLTTISLPEAFFGKFGYLVVRAVDSFLVT